MISLHTMILVKFYIGQKVANKDFFDINQNSFMSQKICCHLYLHAHVHAVVHLLAVYQSIYQEIL